MARNKYPEITTQHILDVSLRLFLEKGYTNVKMQDIVAELGGLTKGAIYHHFKNKEDIFDALLNRFDDALEVIKQIQNSNLEGGEKLKKVIRFSLDSSIKNKDIVKSSEGLLKTPRFLLRQMENSKNKVAPIIQEIIEEANGDGSLSIKYPKAAAESFTLLTNIWLNPIIYPTSELEYIEKLHFFKNILESVGLNIIDEVVIEEFKTLRRNFVE